MSDFIHLHNHTDFSLLDGAVSVKQMVARTKKLGMKAVALTDHGNMFGAIKFFNECKANEVKPIIGSEFYVAPDSRHKKKEETGKTRNHHLVLLARNETGYRNLLKLSSAAYTEGFYYRPRIDDEILAQHSEGLIALTACLAGQIPSLIMREQPEKATEKAGYYQELFGKEHFYLELQDHGIPEQKIVNKGLIELAKKTSIPLVATNDIHYLDKEDATAQDILICIGTNKKLNEKDRLKFHSEEFYFKTPEEMARLFPDQQQALLNTARIGEMIDLTIPLPGPILPEYQIPEGYTLQSFFRKITEDGLRRRYPVINQQIKDRLDYELSVIEKMNFIGYFLIVWDFIKFAKENQIPVGPGRGSGAGSLVAYSLQITDIDPLKYGLLFERFLNPDRISMPDFDVDFCFERREEVIQYVTRKYGEKRVGQIITFGSLKAKAVLRDVARVLDFPYAEADRIAKLIPVGAKNLSQALEEEPELRELQARDQTNKLLIETSRKLEGLNRHASTHAAGIVIGREELTHYVPLYRDPKTGSLSTQFTMEYLEDAGLVKMDFLGLKTLTLIKHTLELLEKKFITLDISHIPENDPATFELLGEGKSACIFQFESSGMQSILKRAKPEKIEDLIALNALYRPGPMENIDQFIDSKFNPGHIKYPLPDLEPILKETYGVIIYQEQVMEIARKVAGYTLGQADILRRAMGKKKVEVMAKEKVRFVDGALKLGYAKDKAEQIFELLVPFAGYGFNKSHAAAYSVLAYQTAYLKANFPAEFMAANLTNEINNTDKLADYIREARDMEIGILPPDINLSEKNFTVVGGSIIYGLLGIKNSGTAAVEEIIRERTENGEFAGIMDFLERVDLRVVNRKVLETLIMCGLFNSFNETRATLMQNLDLMLDVAGKRKESKKFGQGSLFDSLAEEDGYVELEIKPSEEFPKQHMLDMEKQYLGFYFSGHPLDDLKDIIASHTTLNLAQADKGRDEKSYKLVGILKEVKEIITRKGKKMAFAVLEDFRGSIELVIFTDIYEKFHDKFVLDAKVAVSGKLDKSRGNAKIIVDEVSDPFTLPKLPPRKEATAVHIMLSGYIYDRNNLMLLKDFCLQKRGKCTLYLHPYKNGNSNRLYVKAGPEFTVAADSDFLEGLLTYPQVANVWKE